MILRNLLVGINGIKFRGDLDTEVSGVECNSKEIKENNIYVAIQGYNLNGTEFISEAISNGANSVVIQDTTDLRELNIPNKINIIVVPNTRLALALISCNFYSNPSKKMKLIGITGTKGKTTTSFMIKAILEKQGIKVGLIGTIAIYIGDTCIKKSERTTPESNDLQKILAKMYESGVEVVIMEVSSQSLKLDRVEGCEFYAGIFTNFSEDHISEKEHPDMKDYFESKIKLFKACKKIYTNADNLYTAKLPDIINDKEVETYGIDNYCKLVAKDITVTNTYADFKIKIYDRNERVKVSIPGRFSVYNALAAIYIAKLFNIDTEKIKEALENVKVPGRSELIENKLDLKIMIDYAHTPESLESILKTAKEYTTGRVICVFGCGGNRDKLKRPIMGEISTKIADYTIITSDNPRTEKPESIIEEIEAGAKKSKGNYVCITERKEAIFKAIEMANKKDLIILAGKGHETYQEINGQKIDFDEREIIREGIEKIKKNNKNKKN